MRGIKAEGVDGFPANLNNSLLASRDSLRPPDAFAICKHSVAFNLVRLPCVSYNETLSQYQFYYSEVFPKNQESNIPM